MGQLPAKQAIKQLIAEAEIKGRIDELEKLSKLPNIGGLAKGSPVKGIYYSTRLATLQAQLKKGEV
ncbi:MAG: hypothetical protein NVS1B10_01330 [Candidatus Saccharimonadales bacterium]